MGPGDTLLSGLDAAPSVAILRVLRVALHVGFAALLAVAVLRLLLTGGTEPLRYVWAGTAVVLAGVYLTGLAALAQVTRALCRIAASRSGGHAVLLGEIGQGSIQSVDRCKQAR